MPYKVLVIWASILYTLFWFQVWYSAVRTARHFKCWTVWWSKKWFVLCKRQKTFVKNYISLLCIPFDFSLLFSFQVRVFPITTFVFGFRFPGRYHVIMRSLTCLLDSELKNIFTGVKSVSFYIQLCTLFNCVAKIGNQLQTVSWCIAKITCASLSLTRFG